MQKVEIKKLKFYESMSEETSCFEAVVYIDDVPLIHASNDGHGGPNRYSWVYPDQSVGNPYNYVTKIDDYLSDKFQPLVLYKGTDREMVINYDLEQFIDTNINLQLVKKDFNRIMKNVALIMPTPVLDEENKPVLDKDGNPKLEDGVFRLSTPASKFAALKDKIAEMYPNAVILNALPKEEAFQKYMSMAKVQIPQKSKKVDVAPKV